MASIDSIEAIKKIDSENSLQNIQELPDQCERCWADWKSIPLPARFIQAKKIVIAGMGGSALGVGIAADLATHAKSKVPITVWRDYGVPEWLDKDTLFIASSYSGNTEETLSSLHQAALRTDRLITISAGGKVETLSRKYKSVHYKINYGAMPRLALGFSFTSIISIFNQLDLVEVSDDDFREAIILLRGLQKKIDVNMATGYNNAKLLAEKIEGKIPIIFGSGILQEVARRWKGLINENAKTASYFEILPELNHNSLVGLEFPKDLRDKIFVILLQSKFDHPRNSIRQNITLQILQRRRIPCDSVMLEPAPTPISQVLQTIYFGDFVSFYLGILNNVSPNSIEAVDFLKEKLAEKPMEENL